MIEPNIDRRAAAEKAQWAADILGPHGDDRAPPLSLAAIMAAPRWLHWLAKDEERFLALAGALTLKHRWRGRLDGAVVRALADALGEALCDRVLATPSQPSQAQVDAHVLDAYTLCAMGRTILLAAMADQPALAVRLRRRWAGEAEAERSFATAEAQWIASSAHALMEDAANDSKN